MIGKAYCYGAATIVNAIATGKGAAFGIGLKTEASVELTHEPGYFEVMINNDAGEDTALAEQCVKKVLEKYDLQDQYGAEITTNSDIPISRGLKSSSTAANAIVLATLKVLSKKCGDIEAINLGVDAALEAGVTVTGAFDDATASYFGCAVVTDNVKRKILSKYHISDEYVVVIHVPREKIRKYNLPLNRINKIKNIIEPVHKMAAKKDVKNAVLFNGLAYSKALGLDLTPTVKAMNAGAFTAGLSGTGPATAILAEKDKVGDILDAISDYDSDIIITRINKRKAK
ncbi:MAG: shikimate kinase [Thermoplasmata archaeon]